jgi:hypothetical protein
LFVRFCLFVQVGEGFVRLVAEGQTGDMLVIMPGTHITHS